MLIDFTKLTWRSKIVAHKNNLDNITKSGLRQIQLQMFHIIYGIVSELIQEARQSREFQNFSSKN